MTKGIPTRYITGYKVCSMEVEINQRGRIALVWREGSGWQFEGAASFGTNVVSFIFMAGRKLWYVVG